MRAHCCDDASGENCQPKGRLEQVFVSTISCKALWLIFARCVAFCSKLTGSVYYFRSVVYIETGPHVAKMVASKELNITIHLPKLEAAPSAAKPLKKTVTKPRKVAAKSTTKPTNAKRKKSPTNENSSKRANAKAKKPKKSTKEVIDLADDDSDTSGELSIMEPAAQQSSQSAAAKKHDILWDDSEDEYEF